MAHPRISNTRRLQIEREDRARRKRVKKATSRARRAHLKGERKTKLRRKEFARANAARELPPLRKAEKVKDAPLALRALWLWLKRLFKRRTA